MSKFMSLIAVVTLCIGSTAYAAAPIESTKTVKVEMPCLEPGFKVPACAVESSLINGNGPTATVNMDLSAAKAFQGKTQAFMIIHSYKVKQGGLNSDVGLTLNRGQHSIIADIHADKPVLFWVVTHDGGRTWTNFSTNETDTISY